MPTYRTLPAEPGAIDAVTRSPPPVTARALAALLLLLAAPAIQAQTVIVDNSDAGFSVISGAWFTTSVTGQWGSDYRYRLTGAPLGEVEWRPTLPHTGAWQVAVWYRNANDRPSNARYRVHHAGGVSDVFVDQRINGSTWVGLGSFTFNAGAGHAVTLDTDATPGTTIVADAVRFQAVGGGPMVPEVRACWLTQYFYLGKSEAQLRAAAQNMLNGGINTVYIAVYAGGTVYWPSKAYQAAGGSWSSGSVDYAAQVSSIFRSEGLKVGAWFEYGMGLSSVNHPIAVAHPDWLTRTSSGDPVSGESSFVFLSPAHPEAMNLLHGMVGELAANYWFDDIQIDRYRYPRKSSGREFGYEAVSSALYQATYGSAPPTNVNNSQWVAFREGLVNSAMQQSYIAVKSANPLIVVSSAPTGSYGVTQHLQRWSAWVNGGYMDLVMPQMYQATLSGFQTELSTQRTYAPAHWNKLGVGYRAHEDNNWALVRDQLNHARGLGHAHGCLWVYHQYSTQIAIQDEIDNLPLPGQPWSAAAYNPFVSDRLVQLFADNLDGAGAYQESAGWSGSAQTGFHRFDSRVAQGGGDTRTAGWNLAVPKAGRYDVYAWHTASGNRNPAAQFTISHYNGDSSTLVDQRVNGGRWVHLGRRIFDRSDAPLRRVTVSTASSPAGVYTSADAVKLVLSGYAFGDTNGDGVVNGIDAAALTSACVTGPQSAADGGPGGPPPTAACEVFDFDDDFDVDMRDLSAMQRAAGP